MTNRDRDFKLSEIKEICKNQEYCLSYDAFGKLCAECPIVDICLDIHEWVKENQLKCGKTKEWDSNDT